MKAGRRALVLLVAVLVLGVAPAAQAAVNYSMNAAGGDYAPATTQTDPPVATQTDTPVAATDSEFSWGAATLGAGAALAVVLLITVTRTRLSTSGSRREPA